MLGDKDAIQKTMELAGLAARSDIRHNLKQYILPRMDMGALIKAWEKDRPPEQDAVQSAMHAFVLKQLALVKEAKANP